MTLIAERPTAQETAPSPALAAAPPPPPTPERPRREPDHVWRAALVGTLQAIVMVVAARGLLLLTAIGAFALAWTALQSPEPLRLIAAGAYDLLVFLPAVWLASKKG
jgi:hypothetical protein